MELCLSLNKGELALVSYLPCKTLSLKYVSILFVCLAHCKCYYSFCCICTLVALVSYLPCKTLSLQYVSIFFVHMSCLGKCYYLLMIVNYNYKLSTKHKRGIDQSST